MCCQFINSFCEILDAHCLGVLCGANANKSSYIFQCWCLGYIVKQYNAYLLACFPIKFLQAYFPSTDLLVAEAGCFRLMQKLSLLCKTHDTGALKYIYTHINKQQCDSNCHLTQSLRWPAAGLENTYTGGIFWRSHQLFLGFSFFVTECFT